MRRPLFVLTLSVATAAAPLPALAGPASQDPQAQAKRLYEEGRTAYRLGRFKDAVEKFESAYAASGLPTILFNVGLAYERLYTTSNDVTHLRKAIAVLDNFLLEIRSKPELGDPAEVEAEIAKIRSQIEAHDKREADKAAAAEAARLQAERDATGNGDQGEGPKDPSEEFTGPVGPDPGKKTRTIGFALIGTGALVGIGGAIGAGVFAGKANEFEDELVDSYAASDGMNCTEGAAAGSACADLEAQQAALRRNGKRANTGTIVSGVAGGIVGIGLIGAGVGMVMKGKKRTSRWRTGNDLSIAPTRRGFVLSGRF